MSSWAAAAYGDFRTRIQYHEEEADTLKEVFSLVNDKSSESWEIKNMISIGPGRGRKDSGYLSVLPSCTQFTGVECDAGCIQPLKDILERDHPNVQTIIEHKTLDEWQGPDGTVDLVLARHVVSYFEDPQASIRKMMSWLSPGGKLIIVIAENFSVTKYATEYNSEKAGSDLKYRHVNLMKDLDQIKAHLLIEKAVEVSLDLSNKSTNLANVFLQKDASKDETEAVFSYLDKFYPSNVDNFKEWHIVIDRLS